MTEELLWKAIDDASDFQELLNGVLILADFFEERGAAKQAELLRLMSEYPKDTNANGLVERVLQICGASDFYKLLLLMDDRPARLFACWCAEQLLPLARTEFPQDDRLADAVRMARRYVHGLEASEDLAQAQSAAWNAWSEIDQNMRPVKDVAWAAVRACGAYGKMAKFKKNARTDAKFAARISRSRDDKLTSIWSKSDEEASLNRHTIIAAQFHLLDRPIFKYPLVLNIKERPK